MNFDNLFVQNVVLILFRKYLLQLIIKQKLFNNRPKRINLEVIVILPSRNPNANVFVKLPIMQCHNNNNSLIILSKSNGIPW